MTKVHKLANIGVAITLVVTVLFTFGCSEKDNTPTTPPVEPTSPVEPTPTEPTVEIVIYTDFQCGGCAMLHSEVEAELLRLYVDTGKARLEMRLLPALGPESLRAAEAALCAADQGKFWEYRSTILAAWSEVGKAAYSEEQLRQAANELGLNEQAFNACLDSEIGLEILEDNLLRSQAAGVREVPTMFINGIRIKGIEPLETYVNIIEEQLAK